MKALRIEMKDRAKRRHIRVFLPGTGNGKTLLAEVSDLGPATPYILHHRVLECGAAQEFARKEHTTFLRPLWKQLIEVGLALEGAVPWLAKLPLAEAIRLNEACASHLPRLPVSANYRGRDGDDRNAFARVVHRLGALLDAPVEYTEV